MNNLRFATAIHILVLLDKYKGELVTSDFIAGSINVNPVVVRREVKFLRDAGLVHSKQGKEGGLYLGKDSSQIRLGDIYKLVNEGALLGKMNQPNPACPVGSQMNGKLDVLFTRVSDDLLDLLNRQSLADFSVEIE